MSTVTAERAEAQGARDRSARIMRALAESAVPLSTPELVDLLGENIPVRQHALSRYAEVLRMHERAGRVTLTGQTVGAWQQPPAWIWAITGAGRAWLVDYDAALTTGAAARAQAERLAEEGRHARAARAANLEEARALYDRTTPRDVRAQVARGLKESGHSLRTIGAIFGVTGEMIRLDLLWDQGEDRPAGPPTRHALRQASTACALSVALADAIFRLREERGWPVARLAAEAGISASTVRYCESGAGNWTLPVLEKVAAALGMSPLELLGTPFGGAA